MLLIARVGSASFNLGSVFVLVSVLFYALSVLLTRRLRTTDSSATMAYPLTPARNRRRCLIVAVLMSRLPCPPSTGYRRPPLHMSRPMYGTSGT